MSTSKLKNSKKGENWFRNKGTVTLFHSLLFWKSAIYRKMEKNPGEVAEELESSVAGMKICFKFLLKFCSHFNFFWNRWNKGCQYYWSDRWGNYKPWNWLWCSNGVWGAAMYNPWLAEGELSTTSSAWKYTSYFRSSWSGVHLQFRSWWRGTIVQPWSSY